MNQGIFASKNAIEALSKHEILKDVIQTAFKPLGFLQVEYPTKDLSVTLGNKLPVAATQELPSFQFISTEGPSATSNDDLGAFTYDEKSDLFTLVMTDPDAPSRTEKKWSEYCHYVQADIPLKNSARSNSAGGFIAAKFQEEGKTLIPYMGPGPPKGTGDHRYVFLLYQQPKGVKSSSFTKIPDRPNWGTGLPGTGVHKWATENKLKLVAANFFFAEAA